MTRRSLAAILAFLLLFGVPAMHTAYTTRIVPDFLTYRYAYAAAAAGDDPYEIGRAHV